MPDASATARGVVTTGSQTFAGDKTLTGTLNGTSASFSGTIRSDSDFRVVKDGDNTLGNGSYHGWYNTAMTRGWVAQLSGSNYLYFGYYDGSTWSLKQTLRDDGGATLTGALTGTSATFSTSSNYLNLAATSTTGYSAYMYSTSTVAGYIGNGSSLLSGASNSDFIIRSEGALKFLTNGTNLRLTITLGGNVGIGTESPTQLLQVGGNSGAMAIGDGLTVNGTSRLKFT